MGRNSEPLGSGFEITHDPLDRAMCCLVENLRNENGGCSVRMGVDTAPLEARNQLTVDALCFLYKHFLTKYEEWVSSAQLALQ